MSPAVWEAGRMVTEPFMGDQLGSLSRVCLSLRKPGCLQRMLGLEKYIPPFTNKQGNQESPSSGRLY